jgi:alkanesulfonate monooxygenase SsuD/methylene tetrahydromethanopterin reductase-like flavin-dependent oxidoreductase (luciferase family)
MTRRPLEFGYFTQPRGQGDPARDPHPSHKLMLRDAQEAERLGFDAVWVPDHFYMERPTKLETFPECWTLLSAIGATTQRVRLGTMVIAAGFRHPAVLAHMAGALQELTDGRLILGMGAGNQAHEHNAFDLGFDRRIGRFKEYISVMTRLLDGETVSQEGRHYTLREASLRTPLPKVPIWIASGGEQTLDLTARYAQGWNAAGGAGFDVPAFKAKYDQFAAAAKAIGRDVTDYEVSHLSFMGIGADAAEAREIAETVAAEQKTTPEALLKRQAIGTPDEVARRMREIAAVGADHFVCIVNLYPHPERFWDRVELLAREVLPRVRAS